jgi:hypothetical protein
MMAKKTKRYFTAPAAQDAGVRKSFERFLKEI